MFLTLAASERDWPDFFDALNVSNHETLIEASRNQLLNENNYIAHATFEKRLTAIIDYLKTTEIFGSFDEYWNHAIWRKSISNERFFACSHIDMIV